MVSIIKFKLLPVGCRHKASETIVFNIQKGLLATQRHLSAHRSKTSHCSLKVVQETIRPHLQSFHTPAQRAISLEQKLQPQRINQNLLHLKRLKVAKVFFTNGIYFEVIHYENRKKISINIQHYFRKGAAGSNTATMTACQH